MKATGNLIVISIHWMLIAKKFWSFVSYLSTIAENSYYICSCVQKIFLYVNKQQKRSRTSMLHFANFKTIVAKRSHYHRLFPINFDFTYLRMTIQKFLARIFYRGRTETLNENKYEEIVQSIRLRISDSGACWCCYFCKYAFFDIPCVVGFVLSYLLVIIVDSRFALFFNWVSFL